MRSRFGGSAYRFLQTKTGLTSNIFPNPEEARSIRFQWKFFQRRSGKASVAAATAISRAHRKNTRALGLDAKGEAERQIRHYLFKDARKQTPRLAKKIYNYPNGRGRCFRPLVMRGLRPAFLA